MHAEFYMETIHDKLTLLPVCSLLLQIWSDMRYQSLPEARRLQLFSEFMQDVKQQQALVDAAAAQATAAADAAAAAAAAAAVSGTGSADVLGSTGSPPGSSFSSLATDDLDGVDAAGMSPEDLAQLQLLRWEQQRLRQEYQQMEDKLRKMEQKIRSGASSPVLGAPDQPAGAAAVESNGRSSPSAQAADDASAAQQPQVEPVVESLANGEPMNVVVEGGDGDVSVEVNRDGVVVFKFAEMAGSRSSSRASTPAPPTGS
jgi:hypothetical protein